MATPTPHDAGLPLSNLDPSDAELIEHARTVGMVEPEKIPAFVEAYRAELDRRDQVAKRAAAPALLADIAPAPRPFPHLDDIPEEPCTEHFGPVRDQLGCTGPDPADATLAILARHPDQQAGRRAILDSLNTLAHVAIWPHPADDMPENLDATTIEVSYGGLGRYATAYALRQVAARLTTLADVNGDAPLDEDATTAADERNEHLDAGVPAPAPPTMADRADHAVRLYATTAVDLEDARADAAKLRAERDEAECDADRYTARIDAARALHTKFADSQHCEHDSNPWPCPTVLALDADQVEEQPADEPPLTGIVDTARRFARRLAAVEQLCAGHPGYHTITVKQLLTAMSEADDDQADEQPATPTVGDRYVSRNVARTVTVTRVWEAADGHTAVAYEWRDDRPGQCGSACPLDVFHREYRAEASR